MYVNYPFNLFHRCDWCHVIDTVVQLYVTITVGLRIKLKSMSVRSWRPRIEARVLLKKANLSFVLMYVMTDAYGSLHFSANFSASFLFTLLLHYSGVIPPVVVKTRV